MDTITSASSHSSAASEHLTPLQNVGLVNFLQTTGLSTVVICAGRSTYYLIYALQYMMLYSYQIIMAGMAGTIFLPETKDIPLSQGRQTIFILSNFYN